MNLGANLKLLRKRFKRSQEDMAASLGLTRSSYSGYENGVAEPNLETMMKISEFYKIPIDELVRRDFSELRESEWETIESGLYADVKGSKLRVLTSMVDADNNDLIELIPEKARAGYAVGYSDPDYLKVLPTFSLPFLSKDRKYRSFPIKGDSMPPVGEGSYVVAEFVQNWNTVKSGTPYVVVTKDEGIVFKIVYNLLGTEQAFQLCSTNPLYPPYLVHANDILEIWKFVNYISPELPEVTIPDNDLAKSVKGLQKEVSELKSMLRKV
jgi:transcriptional regulator with XRE-family HTH domain